MPLAGLITILCLCLGSLPAAEKPNIIFILVDDMGWSDPSCFGGSIPTPNMDRLAREGMQVRQFYVASPICSASRCGIITGQFPSRWRINSYLQTKAGDRECEQADYLDPRAPSLPRAMKAAGYATAHIGKWHLGGGRDVTDAPKFAAYGYDLGLGTYESPEPAAELGLKTMPWSTEREPQQVERNDRSRWMVDRSIDFLKAHAGTPCFVNLWPDDVHTPHRPREGKDDRKPFAKFKEVLVETDRQIGRLLDHLHDAGLERNTLVLVAGDNGPQPTFDGSRTGGLRGMKWSLYEGGVRTPLIVRWPAVIPAGVINEETVVSGVDLFPTLCHLAEVKTPDGIGFDGEDMSAAFRGDKIVRQKPLLWEYGRKPGSGGKELGAFPRPTEPGSVSPNVAVRAGDWKLLINADGSQEELYQVTSDARESQNVAGKESATASKLRQMALGWRAALP